MSGKGIDEQVNEVLWECIWSKISETIYDTTSEKVSADMYSTLARLSPDSFQVGYLVTEEIENATYH